jgi:hypothetical protein
VVYLGLAVVAAFEPVMPRVFWTIAMPLVPLTVVVLGFHAWRRLCPIATLSSSFAAKRRRGVPRALARWPMSVALSLLFVTLVLRLVATNGDGVALSALLLGIAAAAVVVNAIWSGKTWCHYVCPVGVVERIYAEGVARSSTPSRCTPCTGCARACADLDDGRSYGSTRDTRDRAIATWAFPGLVLGFYTYYCLREGEWAAFFDGRWTVDPLALENVFGPGLWFLPEVPAVVAASATLVLFSLASLALFAGVDRAVFALVGDRARARHASLSIAAFAAFNVFYCFAGAPSLALVPGAQRVVAFVVPVVATAVLARRLFARTKDDPRSRHRIALTVVS